MRHARLASVALASRRIARHAAGAGPARHVGLVACGVMPASANHARIMQGAI
jgi:hypothetical protein